MNCEQSNQIIMVDYLNSIGHQPKKIKEVLRLLVRFSPFKEERKKIHRLKLKEIKCML